MMIVVAALMVAATSVIQSYYAHRGLLSEAEQRAQRELTITQLRIENVTGPIESALVNTVWMVQMNLSNPDTLQTLLRNLLDSSPVLADAAIGFIPDYYPEKGYWYEPVVARRPNGEYE